MLLKKSKAYRRGGLANANADIDAAWHQPATGYRDVGFELSFDMGTEQKREKLGVFIHNRDFALLASLMMEADRDIAIKAFGKAMAKSQPED